MVNATFQQEVKVLVSHGVVDLPDFVVNRLVQRDVVSLIHLNINNIKYSRCSRKQDDNVSLTNKKANVLIENDK